MKTPFLATFSRILSYAGALALLATAIACPGGARPASQHSPAPARHFIKASSLPAPYATPSARNNPRLSPRPSGAELHVPPGFSISEWAAGLNNPRFLTVAPNGDVFVAESQANRVSILRPRPDGAKAALRSVFVSGLRQPFGIAFYPSGPNPKYVYIGDTGAVLRFPYKNGDLKAAGPGKLLIHLTPGGYNQHWTRTLLVSPDSRKLYVSVGSRENVGIEGPPRACIMEYNPDGTGGRVFASGLRNAVGLGISPVTHQLWAAINERDDLGDNVPPDYATHVRDGGFYGWPYYYIGAHHDQRMPDRPDLKAKVITPDVLLEAHCAALSITFGQTSRFPAPYKNSIFVAMHGSWNRSERTGYKVVRLEMNAKGEATGAYEDFAWGWVLPDGTVWGRPVYTAIAKDGSLLITDDGENNIWRVSYK
ncbi:MAG TPA: PQQ-dependent sugar dehydrogenase [Capsulimonadaceae bacterium]|nr:PQQ-dependent sugar dehydrogenase [Capsulimonadaceae bacterium]